MLKDYFESKRPDAIQQMKKRLTLKRVLKVVFPIAALILILNVFLGSHNKKKITVNSAMTMLNTVQGIQYSGQTDKGLKFNIQSKTATEIRQGQLKFEALKSVMQTQHGSQVHLTAREGFFNQEKKLVMLEGDVQLLHDNGLSLKTSQAQFQMDTGVTQGDKPVIGTHHKGVVTADRFRVENAGTQITLFGNPKLVLHRH